MGSNGRGSAHRGTRIVTSILSLLVLLVLALGTYIAVVGWSAGPDTEAPGDIWLIIWPPIWLITGLLTAGGLWTAQRSRVGLKYELWLWIGYIPLWVVGVPLVHALGDQSEVSMIALILAFDGGVLYVISRFLLRGGPSTVLGH
jgi:hypothetical protein